MKTEKYISILIAVFLFASCNESIKSVESVATVTVEEAIDIKEPQGINTEATEPNQTKKLVPSNAAQPKDPLNVIKDILSLCEQKAFDSLSSKYIHPSHHLLHYKANGHTPTIDDYDMIYETKSWSPYHNLYGLKHTLNIIKKRVVYICENEKEGWADSGNFWFKTDKIYNHGNTNFDSSFTLRLNQFEQEAFGYVSTKTNTLFFISKLNNRWYLSLVDAASYDCTNNYSFFDNK